MLPVKKGTRSFCPKLSNQLSFLQYISPTTENNEGKRLPWRVSKLALRAAPTIEAEVHSMSKSMN